MKKYTIHFIYILIIAALAVFSRMKTNELTEKIEEYKEMAERQQQIAEEQAAMSVEAQQAAEQMAAEAMKQAKLAQKAIEDCESKQK